MIFSPQEYQTTGFQIDKNTFETYMKVGFRWQSSDPLKFQQENESKFEIIDEEKNCSFLTITTEEASRLDSQSSETLKEFTRARDMFFRFVGVDKQHDFVLDKIIFIDNPHTESAFIERFRRLVIDSTFLSSSSSSFSSSSVDPSSGGFQDIESILRRDDESRKQQRIRTLNQLENYVEKFSGNERVNLVAAWHGATEEKLRSIAKDNFWKPRDLTSEEIQRLENNITTHIEGVTDPGYFGRGIYFTQFPSYGDIYSSSINQKKSVEGDAIESTPLLLSWVLMGKVFPVIESPTDRSNFLGKRLVEGFDSHYVLVKNAGNRTMFVPCASNESPDYDEIIVSDPSQILPRYIVYYRRQHHL